MPTKNELIKQEIEKLIEALNTEGTNGFMCVISRDGEQEMFEFYTSYDNKYKAFYTAEVFQDYVKEL